MMRKPALRKLSALALAVAAVACGPANPSATSPAASGSVDPASPSPSSITKAQPGGDSKDPELAALTTLSDGVVSRRWDKPETLEIHLVDSKIWRRVTSDSAPARAMFRYGDDSYAMAIIMYQPAEAGDDLASCLAQFMRFADHAAADYDINYQSSPVYDRKQTIKGSEKPMLLQFFEGHVGIPFFADDYVGGVAVYQSFPKTCLFEAFAAISTRHADAARKARDRWAADAAPLLEWDVRHVHGEAPPLQDF